MALTKVQLDSLDTLLAKSPPLKKKDPQAYEKLNAAVTQTVKKFTPEMTAWARTAGTLASDVDIVDIALTAVITAVVDTVITVVVAAATSSDLGAEVEKLGEANIRAIAKDRMSRAAQRM